MINQNANPIGGTPAGGRVDSAGNTKGLYPMGEQGCPWTTQNCGANDEPFAFHPGGCHTGLLDGGVRFLNESVDRSLCADSLPALKACPRMRSFSPHFSIGWAAFLSAAKCAAHLADRNVCPTGRGSTRKAHRQQEQIQTASSVIAVPSSPAANRPVRTGCGSLAFGGGGDFIVRRTELFRFHCELNAVNFRFHSEVNGMNSVRVQLGQRSTQMIVRIDFPHWC